MKDLFDRVASAWLAKEDDCMAKTKAILATVPAQLSVHQRSYKDKRKYIIRTPEAIKCLLVILNNSSDVSLCQLVIYIFNESLGKSGYSKRSRWMVKGGVTEAVLSQVHIHCTDNGSATVGYALLLHQLACKLASRDAHFADKARLLRALRGTLALLRLHASQAKYLQILLVTLKHYSLSTVNCNILGKNGVMLTFAKLLRSQSKRPDLIRLTLTCLKNCLKSSTNAAKFARAGGVVILLNEFTSHRDSKLRVLLLQALLASTNSKSAREVVVASDSTKALYAHVSGSLSSSEVTRLACLVIRKCSGSHRLPVIRFSSPYHYNTHGGGDCGGSDDDDDETGSMDSDMEPTSDTNGSATTKAFTAPARYHYDMADYARFFPELLEENFSDEILPQEPDDMVRPPSVSKWTNEYKHYAQFTKHVVFFSKLAYPDVSNAQPPPLPTRLVGTSDAEGSAILADVDRIVHSEKLLNFVAYDLDDILSQRPEAPAPLVCEDERDVQTSVAGAHLRFCSTFECGNLRRAVHVREAEYDLLLTPDIGTKTNMQWFYWQVSNMRAGVDYRFNILNNLKPTSEFQEGMQPVVLSVKSSINTRTSEWRRTGTNIAYYKNYYSLPNGGFPKRSYYTLTFTLRFPYDGDICYVAYHYPYTYSRLTRFIQLATPPPSTLLETQTIAYSLGGNPVNLLTVTSRDTSLISLESRPYIFLSARVHPGESNASWMMEGLLERLLSSSSSSLLQRFVFKIVPMLNPDGVINGNNRVHLGGRDLNRCWANPDGKFEPTIFHTKAILLILKQMGRTPLVFVDMHGHSRAKNVFMYGNSASLSWNPNDTDNPCVIPGSHLEDTGYKTFPQLLSEVVAGFSYENCSFVVQLAKESTARCVVWREGSCLRSYTLEATYCGFDCGPLQGQQVTTTHLKDIGGGLLLALSPLKELSSRSTLTSANTAPIGLVDNSEEGSSASDNSDTDAIDSDEDLLNVEIDV